MKLKTTLYFSVLFLLMLSCKAGLPSSKEFNQTQRHINDVALNGKVYTAVWQQNSGEFRALCYQAYNVAKSIVDQKTSVQYVRPLAIITDVDETFLDNSPYAVTQAKLGNEFDEATWLEWTSQGNANAYPGSVEFFNYAASKGITIFYITNRNQNDKPGTVANLKKLGFPYTDEEHVVVRQETSNKKVRRLAVLQQYDVILYLGDNLGDFSETFYHKSQSERNAQVDAISQEFGTKFIVLPNAGYGDWESAIPGYSYELSPKQKDSILLKSVKGY